MVNSKHTPNKKIPTEESDSEEEESFSKKSESSDEEDMIEDDSIKSKKSKSTKKGKINIDSFIAKKIKEYKEIESNKEFDVPEEVDADKMVDRYNWLYSQIGETGIPCRPGKKEVDNVRYFILGVSKSLKLHLFYPAHPEKDYSTPTEVLRDIYIDNDIPTKSIKGWDQSYVFVKKKKLSPTASWLIFNCVIPKDYRKRKAKSNSKSPKKSDEKVQSKRKSDSNLEEKSSKKKKSRPEKILEYAHNVEEMLTIPHEVGNEMADMVLRLQLIRGAISLDINTIKNIIKNMNSSLESKSEILEKPIKEEKPIEAVIEDENSSMLESTTVNPIVESNDLI